MCRRNRRDRGDVASGAGRIHATHRHVHGFASTFIVCSGFAAWHAHFRRGRGFEREQELDPEILRHADLLLVDSLPQCEKLGELQHAPDQRGSAVEIGSFCQNPRAAESSVADLTGLGVEDLYIAETVYEHASTL